jgi:hypothetical protein
MQQLLAGSSFNEQIQENLNKSDFGFCALSQQLLQSEYITTQEIPHFLQPASNCCIVQITTSLPPITGFLLSNNRLKH